VSDDGQTLFTAALCCGKFTEGIFKAVTASIAVPSGGFEIPGHAGLPGGWQTWWTNSGSGATWQYNSGGVDAFEGNSVLRLHVNPGGGSLFALSDPIPVSPGASFRITCRMRFYFSSNSDRAYFSVIQEDGSGRAVDFNEVAAVRGESLWSWIPKSMVIRASPEASAIRVRFGLVAGSESYFDIDSVR
jgi:hypothetical protein